MSDQAENKPNFIPIEPDVVEAGFDDEMALDDARRVKVLSPGMLVFKRFIRNKLAVAGLVIIVFMFLFAFCGTHIFPLWTGSSFYWRSNNSQRLCRRYLQPRIALYHC